ncbi:MAG: hypothetical protein ACREJM_06110, partial [Candidatus Saccharimonadales bacterium]
MSVRKSNGATLGLVVTVTVVIVIIGVAIFYLLKIFGGQRELQNASDAGTLNIAKQALVEPWATFDTSDPVQASLAGLGATKPNGAGVDLFTYNRLVGQEFIVAVNASADGGTTGLSNASTLVTRVQTLANTLKTNLNDPTQDHNWVSRFFNVAQTNSVRMENGQSGLHSQGSSIVYNPQSGTNWNTAYMDKGSASNMLLNLSSIGNDQGAFPPRSPYDDKGIYPPYSSYDQATTFDYSTVNNGHITASNSNNTWLQGYTDFSVSGVSGDICAIPTEPDSLPHGISLSQFAAASNPATLGLPTWVPPNAFQTKSQTLVEKTGAYAGNSSAAIIGTAQQTEPGGTNNLFWAPNANYPAAQYRNGFVMGLPNGYIVVDNTGVVIPGQSAYNPNNFNMP